MYISNEDIKKYGIKYYIKLASDLEKLNTFTAYSKANHIWNKINEYKQWIKKGD